MTSDTEILQAFDRHLYADIDQSKTFPAYRPLLAHYTTISTLECIARTNQVWFSNPLLMNDHEELRFGMVRGAQHFVTSTAVRAACGTAARAELLVNAFNGYFNKFDAEALDVYIFCLSHYARDNVDGLLSMWRGYGGNGNGAAIVFDSSKLSFVDTAPLIISRVTYASTERRLEWINRAVNLFAGVLKAAHLPDDKLHVAAWAFFSRLKRFALFSKHKGFDEEQEWRVVYLAERDTNKVFEPLRGYAVGPRGLEPKLKLPVAPLPGATGDDMSLDKIVDRIILGPTISSPIAKQAVIRMLENVRPELKDRVHASTIPFRSTT